MMLGWILTILAAWLLADLITGAVHWYEDRFMTDGYSLDFANVMAADNALHHEKPTAMLLYSWWENMRSAALVAWPVAVVLALIGSPVWLWLGVAFSGFGNLIHRFAHEPKRNLPRWVCGLQKFGLFLSREHHDTHHRSDGDLIDKQCACVAYCPMTDWMNPWIDRIRLWDWLEWLLYWLGLRPISKEACA